MGKESISSRNLRSLLIIIVLCGSLMNGAFTVMQDTWVSILLMGVIYLPIILVYSRICKIHQEKNLFEIIEILFGRVWGFIFILLMTFYSIVVAGLQLRNFTEFTAVIALQDTPRIPLMIAIIVPVLYLAKKGVEMLGRWSYIACMIIVGNVILTFFLSFNVIDIRNLFPIMNHNIGDILSNSHTVGTIAVGESVMVLAIMGKLKKTESPYKVYVPGILVGILFFALVIIRNLLILGPYMEQSAKFSTYMAVRIINVGNFFERIESSVSFVYIILGITKMVLFLSAASMGISWLMKLEDYKKFLVPVLLLVMAVSTMAFKNVFDMYNMATPYRFFVVPFQAVIPIIIWITSEIKLRTKSIKLNEPIKE